MTTASKARSNSARQLDLLTPIEGARDCDIVVIGAGPYGLSSASHLKAAGYDVRVFGKPMQFWGDDMPAGMLLRSPRVASNIDSPTGAYSLENFEKSAGLQAVAPLPLETFVAYGQWFPKAAHLDTDGREIASIAKSAKGFKITLDDGSVFSCRRVVVAAGVKAFQRIPQVFNSLDPKHFSHVYSGCDVRSYAGKNVLVIGAGQSGLETGALLHEAGADVEIIARLPQLRWIGSHPWLHNMGPISSMLYSYHDIGPLGISRLVAAPNLVKHIPLSLRDKLRKRAVRSAGSRWLPARLTHVKMSLGRSIKSTRSTNLGAEITLDDGTKRTGDYVVLGTGYDVDVSRYQFLSPEIKQQLDVFGGYPRLRPGFHSSVDGMYFIGATAARTFGPLLQFVTGTTFAAKELLSKFERGD